MDSMIEKIKQILTDTHKCHTVILYGSYARGDARPSSDVDMLGFREDGEMSRDARLWEGIYLDLFIYPESKLKTPDESMLHNRDGMVLVEKNLMGTEFLKKLKTVFEGGPKKLPHYEIQARKVWSQKMLDRAKDNDIEANYRWHWLMTALLEDYFKIRGLWYLGSKESFKWLQANDLETYELFEKALQDMDIRVTQNLVKRVVEHG